jgi:predicted DCC family thiol-disulfide oxidoreductase YuxK
MSRAFALRAVARVSASRTAASRAWTSRASVARASSASSSPASSSSTEDAPTPSWQFRVLYDGACPLCVREIEMLRAKDDGRGALSLVDVADDAYSPSDNAGIEYETAMATIHGLTPDKRVITGVEVFERAYSAVGMGWVYAFTKVPALLNAANAVYDVWARNRLEVTGRGSLAEHLKARKARADGETCEVGKACE